MSANLSWSFWVFVGWLFWVFWVLVYKLYYNLHKVSFSQLLPVLLWQSLVSSFVFTSTSLVLSSVISPSCASTCSLSLCVFIVRGVIKLGHLIFLEWAILNVYQLTNISICSLCYLLTFFHNITFQFYIYLLNKF